MPENIIARFEPQGPDQVLVEPISNKHRDQLPGGFIIVSREFAGRIIRRKKLLPLLDLGATVTASVNRRLLMSS